MRRRDHIDQISAALGDRALVWFGIRGDDAAPLLRIPQFTDCFALTARLNAATLTTSVALEELVEQRMDLDEYQIETDNRTEVAELRRQLLARLNHRSAFVCYRPTDFSAAVAFASEDTSRHLGLFAGRQEAFEHKPWVETQLRQRHVPMLAWRYIADERRDVLRRQVERGPIVVRPSHTSGGVGIELVTQPDEVDLLLPDRPDHLVSYAPYLDGALPVNVGAVVYVDGTVVIHPGSVQLIGVPGCTHRRFGYCGNDFAAFASLPEEIVEQVEAITLDVGTWLFERGYAGAFGVDHLIDGDRVLFGEVNPRFQGSTALSAELAALVGEVDIVLDHLAAVLGLAPPLNSPNLAMWARIVPPRSQVIVHEPPADAKIRPIQIGPTKARLDLVPPSGVTLVTGAVRYRAVVHHQVTSTGFDLLGIDHQSQVSPPQDSAGGRRGRHYDA